MLGQQHALTGAVAAIITAQVFDATWLEIGAGAIAVLGASLYPDIDHERSTVSNTFGPFSRFLSWVICKLTGGHRRGTHSVLGIAALALLVQVCLDHRGTWWSIAVLTVVMSLLIAGPLRLLKIKGWLDDVIPVPIALAAAWWPEVPLRLLPVAIFIGAMVHVLGDMITKQGCPVLWPLSAKRYRLAWLKAGGWTERYVLRWLFVIAIPVAACWEWINPWWLELVAEAQKYLAQ